MGGDISDSAKLGVGVLILCFLMGIIFNLFTMTRGVTTKSSNQLQSSFNTVADSAYATYDNTTVFGSQVLNAITTYAAEKMCIVVSNKTMASNTTPSASPAAGDDSTDKAFYYGYGIGAITKPSASSYYTGTLSLVESSKNNITSGTKAIGKAGTFINESKRYDAHLIKDPTRTVVGICFELRGD